MANNTYPTWKYFFRNGNVGTQHFGLSEGLWRFRTKQIPGDGLPHKGVDIDDPDKINNDNKKGPQIFSVCSGKVIHTVASGDNDYSSMGNSVVVEADEKVGGKTLILRYLHLAERSNLRKDDRVTENTFIGYIGGTGASSINHLHFDVNNIPSIYPPGPTSTYNPNSLIDVNKDQENGLINPREFFSTNNGDKVVFGTGGGKQAPTTPVPLTNITWHANEGRWNFNGSISETRTIASVSGAPIVTPLAPNPPSSLGPNAFFQGWFLTAIGPDGWEPIPANVPTNNITYYARWRTHTNPGTGGGPDYVNPQNTERKSA